MSDGRDTSAGVYRNPFEGILGGREIDARVARSRPAARYALAVVLNMFARPGDCVAQSNQPDSPSPCGSAPLVKLGAGDRLRMAYWLGQIKHLQEPHGLKGWNTRALKLSRTFRTAADGQSSGTGPMSGTPWKHTPPI